ncbi:hypothetical protein BU17DRAFT_59830 [Hysterangium stoloniferum]|nr:hypothetical protein BU17DRAFT_59830 [Hysterangium stoloniferum]
MFSILYVKYQLGHIFKQGWKLFHLTESGVKARKAPEAECMKYIYETGPEKFHDLLTPDWDIARKHRIWDIDGKYLKSLGSPNVNLTKDPIVEFVPGGVRTTTKNYHADAVLMGIMVLLFTDVNVIKPILRGEASEVEVKDDAEKTYTKGLQAASQDKIWTKCNSWYMYLW